MTLKNGSLVTGNVAVVEQRSGQGSARELALEGASTILGSTRADTILLPRNSRISGNASFNRLLGPGTVEGQRITPLELPLDLPMPEIPDVDHGQTDVLVSRGETRELASGSYDDIELRSGRTGEPTVLRLRGGMYPVESLSMGSNSRVECSAACTLVVEERIETDSSVFIGPRAGSNLASRDIDLLVQGEEDHGSNGNGNSGSQGDRDIEIGSRSEVRARLFAPDGALRFGSDVVATGAFVARDVVVGVGSRISKEDAPGCTGPIDDGDPCTTDACSPTGEITHTPVDAGTSCSNGNSCDGAEVCNALGACVAGTPVVCTPLDQCHDAGTCDPGTGECSNPPKTNGSTCDDFNVCTQTDTCQGGTCTGANPVVCTPSDLCHNPGVCNPLTGLCTNPVKDDGESCTDGLFCNGLETCQGGTCVGGGSPLLDDNNPCTIDACTESGGVTHTPAPGTSCSNGNACDGAEVCNAQGVCAPGTPVVCTALDQCHNPGECIPATGECTHPAKSDGTGCNDGSACTQSDTCQGGTCTGDDSVVCVALDQCHDPGVCDPATGACSDPEKPTGASCDDANGCTTGDSCEAGTCVSGMPVLCQGNDCHEPGVCDPATGACSLGPPRPDGTVCNDGTLCTGADLCEDGECVGGNPVVCVAQDACHETGVCDPLTGACSNPIIPGTSCPLPPDPATVAPPNDPTVATNLGDSTEFLYSGDNPIQTGVAAGTIDRRRAAVLRGRVETREGAPLPGVDVVVHDHPEFGATKSRADGYFDLAVNGGGFLTVAYKKEGYLPAQRQVQAPWLDFAQVPDVTLVPLDPSVTTIDLNAVGLQAHKGSWTVDERGARRMTLLFEPGTQATMTLADCTTQVLDVLNVRATEYTVGPNGRAAMPAALPATSAYTYASELSADEAIAAGATRVDFSRPVVGYLTNFLGFPTGTPVPLGSFDSQKSEWVSANTGVVLGILESADDQADIDADGDGLPDDDSSLDALGIGADERRFLKGSFSAPTSLWRIEVEHLTPWDPNYPVAPVSGSPPPNNPPPYNPSSTNNPAGCDTGCVIEIENQILKESIPIVGTPFALAYRSDRVLGRDNRLRIPVTGSSVAPGLREVRVALSGGGRFETRTFPAAPDQEFVVNWNRSDAYDRPIQGDERLNVSITYNYEAFYWATGRWGGPPLFSTGVPAPEGEDLTQFYSLDGDNLPRLSNWDGRGQGLGGWTINAHHVYDPQSKTLHLGDGRIRTVESLRPEIATSAGMGAHGFSGDGGPAKNAQLDLILATACPDSGGGGGPSPILATFDGGEGGGGDGGPGPSCDPFGGGDGGGGGGVPPGFAVASDGGYYIADLGNCRVRRVDPDGIIETVAGTGFCDFGFAEFEPEPEACSEPTLLDRQALEVDITPIELTVAPDGDVYIVSAPVEESSGYGYGGDVIANYDVLASKIFRLDVETGTIRRVAGNGFDGSFDEGVPATQAKLRARDVAVSPDGSIYIADTGNQRIRRVAPDGIIETVAGDGFAGSEGDGGAALSARFNNPTGLAISDAGVVYVADQGNGRIRRLRPDGIIETVAGGGFDDDDGAFPLDAFLMAPIDVALGPDGSVHFADIETFFGGEGVHSGRVRKITPEGTVETIAGVPRNERHAFGEDFVERQAATSVRILPTDVDVAPDGSVYVEDIIRNRILRVTPPLPGVGVSDMFIPSEDAGEVFVFDKAGRHLRSVNPQTGTALLTFSYDPATRAISGIADANNNTTTIQRVVGANSLSITSPFNQVTHLELDDNGYLSLVRNPANEESLMTYASGGLLSTFTDPRGGLHEFAWNEQGRLIGETNPAGDSKSFDREDTGSYEVEKSSAMGRTSSVHVDGPQGGPNTTVVTHPDGTQTVTVMQTDGTTIRTTPDGTRTTVRRFPDQRFGTLSPVSEVITETPGGHVSVTSSTRQVVLSNEENPFSVEGVIERTSVNGDIFETVYDAATKSVARTSPSGRQTFETLDEQGRIVRRDVSGLASTIFSYNESGLLESVTRGPRVTTFSYNEQGQLDSVTAPLGQVTQFLDYDGAGRAQTQILPGNRTVAYTFDGNSNITSVTPPDRPEHALDYTPLDLLSAYEPPEPNTNDGGLWSTGYTYDPDRSLDLVSRPDGSNIDYRYDDAGRLESIVFPSPTDPSADEISALGYDAAGRLETVTSPSGVTLTYGYDGPLVVSEMWSGNVNGSLLRGYDDHLRVVAETIGGTPTVTFGYDADGFLTQAGPLSLSRDPRNGLLISAALGALSETFGYNAFGELRSHTTLAPGGSTLYEVSYERDALGRIANKTETIGGVTTTYGYGYDSAGRLQAVTKDGVETARYTYDANGNRLSKLVPGETPVEGTYDDQDRVTTYGESTFTHSGNGEMSTRTTADGTAMYHYDVLGSLRRFVATDGTAIDYLVDGRSRRVGKKVNGIVTQAFIYNGAVSPAVELDGSGNVVSRFVYGTRINVPEYLVRNNTTYRVVTDHLGSVRLVVDISTGIIAQRIDYDAWGGIVFDSNPGFQPFGFAGGLYEQSTNLVRFGARDYDPKLGRWTAKDPLGLTTDLNPYAYMQGDPIGHPDPLGLCDDDCDSMQQAILGTLSTVASAPFPAALSPLSSGASIATTFAQLATSNDPNASLSIALAATSATASMVGALTVTGAPLAAGVSIGASLTTPILCLASTYTGSQNNATNASFAVNAAAAATIAGPLLAPFLPIVAVAKGLGGS